MEYIREALRKARTAAADQVAVGEPRGRPQRAAPSGRSDPPPAPPAWSPPRIKLDARHLEEHRIVSYAMSDPSHIAFNLLRTRVRTMLGECGWKSVAVTSPTAGCGKTMVALNLAFTLARAASGSRVVLLDLDLRKPAVARTLGVTAPGSVVDYLEGRTPEKDCFVQVADNLVVGLNDRPIKHSSEMMQSPRMLGLISWVFANLSPDVLLFDLPPMRSSDDALAFLPNTDTALLVIAAGQTGAGEVEECERQISQVEKLLGIVLNKSEERPDEYYA